MVIVQATPPVAPEPSGDARTSWLRYRLASDSTHEVSCEVDVTGTIRWVSPSTRSLLGWDPAQVTGHPLIDLIHPHDRERIAELCDSCHREGIEHTGVTTMAALAEGGYREVTLSGRPTTDPDGTPTGALVTLADTHDRDAALRALATLSQANRILVHATEETALLQDMCNDLIETGRYALAWYGRPVDDAEQSVEIVARAGDTTGYLDEITVSWGDTPHGQGPTGRCLREGTTQVQNRFEADPDYLPWAATADRYGFRGSISLPVTVAGRLDGALMVYAHELGAFDTLAVELLENLASDLGYGLERIRDLHALQDTTTQETALRQRFESIVDSSIDPLVLMEAVRDETGQLVDLRYTEANAAAMAYNQLTRERMIGGRLLDLFPGQLEHGPLRQYFHTIETGEPTVLDDYAYGHEVLAEERRYDIRAAKCGDGIALTWRDVTDRHRAAQDLAESEARYRLLAENASDVILLSTDGRTFSWASESSTATLGWTPEQLVGHAAIEFIHPDDVENLIASVERSRRSGEIERVRSRWRWPDGTYRWVESAGRPVDDGTSGFRGRIITVHVVDDQVRAEQDLATREHLYRVLAENSSDVVVLGDDHGTLTWVSPSSLETLGWNADDLIGHSAAEFLHPDDVPVLISVIQESNATGSDVHLRYRWRRPDGSYVWIDAAGHPVRDPATGADLRVVRLRDIDDQMRAEQELTAREERYRLLAENASDVVWQVGPDGTLLWTSPSVTRLLGWQPEEILGTIAMDLIHPEDRPRAIRDREHVLHGQSFNGEFRVLTRDGSSRWTALSARPVPTPEGLNRILSLRDIEDEIATRSQLEFVLEHDHLTGLPTRAGVARRLEFLLHGTPGSHRVAVLYLGIDSLADVNDALGHLAGDLVLGTCAARIADIVGEEMVGRGSGDEFIALLPSLQSGSDAAPIAEQIRRALREPMDIDDHTITVTASIGITVGNEAADADALIRDAALAMHQVKDSGRDQHAFADPSTAGEAEQRLAVEASIREALESGDFTPWLQPIVDLTTRRPVGYEALARWQHADGTMGPADFVPIASRSALITEIDLAILEPSIAMLATLPDDVYLSVNVTGLTLSRLDYASLVAEALTKHGVDPRRLHLEITETLLVDLSQPVLDQMQALADLGCQWYVDDFGTGYSSISHLRDLPVAGLKLDKSFTDGIGDDDETSRQLAMGLVGMANGLGLDTIAEGVETEGEAAFLRTLGWRHGQGWLFGRPAPATKPSQ